jgi:hypothetical protein
MNYEMSMTLAYFLLDNTGSVFGTYIGTMKAKDQRALFGQFIGKGRIIIDGIDETVIHIATDGRYGLGYFVTFNRKWHEM